MPNYDDPTSHANATFSVAFGAIVLLAGIMGALI